MRTSSDEGPVGLMYLNVALRGLAADGGVYQRDLLVDTGATDSMAPAADLIAIGMAPTGTARYELADGTVHEYPVGPAQIELMGDTTWGRIIFGPAGAEPILGVTALESVGITIDPATRTLKRLAAVPLK